MSEETSDYTVKDFAKDVVVDSAKQAAVDLGAVLIVGGAMHTTKIVKAKIKALRASKIENAPKTEN